MKTDRGFPKHFFHTALSPKASCPIKKQFFCFDPFDIDTFFIPKANKNFKAAAGVLLDDERQKNQAA